MALREMMEMKETMGGQGMPQSLDTMAAVRGGGMPPQPQGMMPSAPSPAMAPQEMPQPAPAMAGPAMPPSGLAGISPPVAPQPEVDPLKIMGGIALATLMERGEKKNMLEQFSQAAEDRGVNLPSQFSEETGGLMRLAAEGGPVLYRREGGVPKSNNAKREAILAQMQRLADIYGVKVPKMGEPLDYFTNNPLVTFSGGGGDEIGDSIGELYVRDFDAPGGVMSMSGRGFNRVFEQGSPLEGIKGYRDLANELAALDEEPEKPTSVPFTPLSDMSYGSLNDPNLPTMDAAQQRLQYRQNVGFFEQPPGPTANTQRLLSQAYGEGTPIYEEVLQGLQPTPTKPISTETAMKAYYGLPGKVYDPEQEVQVEAQTGGGLYELAAGGEFSGRVPGDGGGMQDNVYMPIREGQEQVATLAVSPTEYVVDSHTMAALGNGNPDKGADYMDQVVKNIRQEAYGTDQQPNEIDGLASLQDNMMG
jgi:hypothetical protein